MGIISLFKQTYFLLLFFSVIQIFYIEVESKLQKILLIALGFIFPWVVILLYHTFYHKTFDSFIYSVFTYNISNVIGIPTFTLVYQKVANLFSLIHRTILLICLSLGSISLLSPKTRIHAVPIFYLLFTGIFSVLVGGNRLFSHYFILITFPTYLLAAPGLSVLPKSLRFFLSISIIIFTLFLARQEYTRIFTYKMSFNFPNTELISYLQKYSSREDSFWFDGISFKYYYELKIPSPTKHLTIDAVINPQFIKEKFEMIDILCKKQIKWIVTDNKGLAQDQEFINFLAKNYKKQTTWEYGAIYSLKNVNSFDVKCLQ